MVKDKNKFALWITPEVKEDVARSFSKYGAKSQSEFIESAIVFYLAYLRAEDDEVFLPDEISRAIKRSLDPLMQKIGSILFKVAVEQDIGNHILAYDTDIDLKTLDKLRWRCVNEVRSTNGRISFKDALKFQKSL